MADWTAEEEDFFSGEPKKAPVKEPPVRSPWQRFKDETLSGALHSVAGAEGAMRYGGVGRPKGMSDEELNRRERALTEQLARKRQADEAAFKNADTLSPANIGKHAVDIIGNIVGGIDPTYILGPGKTAIQRIAAQAGINAGVDAGSQAVEIKRKVRDKFDPWETIIAGTGGAVIQGTGEVARGIRTGRKIASGSRMPGWKAVNDVIVNDLEGGGTLSNPKTSPKGAMGPQQVMPETARKPGFGIRPWDGKSQADLARVGRQYSAAMMHEFNGDPAKVLAAYNGGPNRVKGLIRKYGNDWRQHLPDETRAYVRNGMKKLELDLSKVAFMPSEIKRARETLGYDLPANDGISSDLDAAIRNGAEEALSRADDNVVDFGEAVSNKKKSIRDEKYAKLHSELDDTYLAVRHNIDNPNDPNALSSDEISNLRTSMEAQRYGFPHGSETHDRFTKIIDALDELNPAERHSEVLTEREKQEMDASVPTVPRDSSHEKFTPNVGEPKTPSNENGVRIVGDLPKKEMAPAILHKDGRIYVGQAGSTHTNILMDHPGLEDFAADNGGFITPEGKYLTRREAAAQGDIHALAGLAYHDPEVMKLHEAKDRLGEAYGKREITEKEWYDAVGKLDAEIEKIGAGGKANPRTIKQILKDLLNDESGELRGDSDGDNPKGPDGEGPEAKLIRAIKDAEPLRDRQDRAYSRERAKRAEAVTEVQAYTEGEQGYFAELSKMKGELPKVEYESIRHKFSQEEIDGLFDQVKHNTTLSTFDKINARQGLSKILGEHGTGVPTNSEIKLLSEVFPEELVNALLAKRPLDERIWRGIGNALNIPRSLLASFDLSAPLRQGVFLVGRKEFYTAFAHMFKQFGSEKAFKAVQDEIASRPNYPLMHRAGLSLTQAGRFLEDREEAFMSDWAERIPIVGRGVHASNRAYIGFLNRLRADVFDSLVKQAADGGLDLKRNSKALRDVARFINAATGRGSLGKFNQAAPLLSAVFFSPRLMASRFNTLSPVWYVTLHPFARKEALKSLLSFSGIAVTVLSLAAAAGVSVDTDPRSSDFGKIRVGNTRFDILGGYQQYLRTGAQLITGETVNADTRKVTKLGGEGYKPTTRLDVVARFFTNKFSPVASFITDMLRGRNAIGQEIKFPDALIERFVPLMIQDMQALYEEHGAQGLFGVLPGIFGVGVQTYKPTPKKTKKSGGDDFFADKKEKKSKDEDFFK